MKYILLSYPINEDTPKHKSLPMPGILPHSQISKGDEYNSVIISIHNHTGTHIDAPKHYLDDGKLISEYLLDDLVFKNPVMVDCLKRDGVINCTGRFAACFTNASKERLFITPYRIRAI